MVNLFSIQQQQEYPLFGRFNARYGDVLVDYCPLLSKFLINVLTVPDYKGLPDGAPVIDDIEIQPFASFITKYGETADTANAGIVINTPIIEQLGFTEPEQHSAIAHEIGHILFFFLDNKANYPGPCGEEIYCDSIAARIGLSVELLSTIEKLENSGLFPDSTSCFEIRKLIIIS